MHGRHGRHGRHGHQSLHGQHGRLGTLCIPSRHTQLTKHTIHNPMGMGRHADTHF